MTYNRSEQDLLSIRFQIAPEAVWHLSRILGQDGYERIDAVSSRGWIATPSWGSEGWGFGAWPLVIIFHRQSTDGFELAYDVEGDVSIYRYSTRELRDAATDCLAFWHWKHDGADWVDDVDSLEDAPDRLRGPSSRERLDAVTMAQVDALAGRTQAAIS